MFKGYLWGQVFTTLFILEIMGRGSVSCQFLSNGSVNISCVYCEVCPPYPTEKVGGCHVCFKRIVRHAQLGRGGPPNNRSSVHRGCTPLEEVRKHNWEIGSCYNTSTSGDDTTAHFQCLCNDRDECNSVGWMKPPQQQYRIYFTVMMLIRVILI